MSLETMIAGPLRNSVKASLRPLVRAAQPRVASAAARSTQKHMQKQGVSIRWAREWNNDLDQALDHLPAPPNCTRDQYRNLLLPTVAEKRHALVSLKDEPLALISLRRRTTVWEPVAYQSLTGYIAPAKDLASLGLALNALGLEISMTGIGDEAHQLGARHVWPVQIPQVRLQEDYEAYWRQSKGNKQLYTVRSARRKCGHMEVCVDREGDLEWVVDQWVEKWKDHPENETIIRDDRIRFWNSLERPQEDPTQMTVHAIVLRKGDTPVAGVVHSRIGDTLLYQCTARDPNYDKLGVGVAVLDASMQWAAAQGYARLDMGGGGHFKELWAPIGTTRNIVHFCPKIIDTFNRINRQ